MRMSVRAVIQEMTATNQQTIVIPGRVLFDAPSVEPADACWPPKRFAVVSCPGFAHCDPAGLQLERSAAAVEGSSAGYLDLVAVPLLVALVRREALQPAQGRLVEAGY